MIISQLWMDTNNVHPGIILKLHYFKIDVLLVIIVCLVVFLFSLGSVYLGKNVPLEMIVILFNIVVLEVIAVFVNIVILGNIVNLESVAVSEKVVVFI